MGTDVTARFSSGRTRRFKLSTLLFSLSLGGAGSASAGQATLRTYGVDQGLTNVGGTCMVQDRSGFILVCSQEGVFAYDGRRFVKLGPDQGLRDGGIIYGIIPTTAGRIAVQYNNEILISDAPADPVHFAGSLRFRPILHPGIRFDAGGSHRLTSWREGLVLLAEKETVRIVIPSVGSAHIEAMGYSPIEEMLLDGAHVIYSIKEHLWEVSGDGRICAADPGVVRCFGAADSSPTGRWIDVVAGSGDTIVARSASSVETLEPASGEWKIVALPDQGDRYMNFRAVLGLFRDPDGNLATQAEHGLLVLRDGAWKTITVAQGAPAGTIVAGMTDATGQFWLQASGQGLIRWVGYGHWETVDKADGLSDGFAWQTARMPDGPMWVSTDTGVNEVDRGDDGFKVRRVVNGSSFSIAIGPDKKVWSSFGIQGLQIIDPAAGPTVRLDTPPVNVIVSDQHHVIWIGTEGGLMRVDTSSSYPLRANPEGTSRAPVADVVLDGSGGIFYLGSGYLRHRHRDGSDIAVSGPWPNNGFNPVAIAPATDGSLWIGGLGGLFRFRLVDDHVSALIMVPPSDTQSSTIVAMMIDHRGWIWTGSALGVSVFDGSRWVSVNTDDGLLANDVNQGGLREDPDGSIWIVTSHGLSHLLDPAVLFASQRIKVVISNARLGTSPVTGQRMPYSIDGMSVQFGTTTYAAERSVIFRYRLSGVDADWVDTSTGDVHYPFVPPGLHLLTVIGIDRMTHRSSDPCTLEVDVAFPWWRQWWADVLWMVCATIGFYGLMRLRLHAVLARQAELKRHVAEATAQLRYQAAHDSLTGLLNRSEIERRLATALAGGSTGGKLIMALLDIDHFKHVNDRYGHLAGDSVLRTIGRLVADARGEGDLAGRYGGEEILLVLHDANGEGVKRVVELHRAIEIEAIKAAGTVINVTCSIGLAWAVEGDNWESLLGRADWALYDAKASGRNRVTESPRINCSIVQNVAGARSANAAR